MAGRADGQVWAERIDRNGAVTFIAFLAMLDKYKATARPYRRRYDARVEHDRYLVRHSD